MKAYWGSGGTAVHVKLVSAVACQTSTRAASHLQDTLSLMKIWAQIITDLRTDHLEQFLRLL
jgi:hypothetical protein